MYQADQTKNQLQQIINNNQSNINFESKKFQRRNRDDLIGTRNRHRRKSIEMRDYLTKNTADIQLNQIQLKHVDQAKDVIKQRIDDEENLLHWGEKFPYGKENVDISEDVLERYRGNYQDQARMLERFRLEAQNFRKTHRNFKSRDIKRDVVETINYNRRDSDLQRMKQKFRRELEQRERMRRLQRKKMKDISSMLSNLSLQLHNNSYTLDKGLRELQKSIKVKRNKQHSSLNSKKPPYKDIIDLMDSSNKIPLIVYKDQVHDARLYFSDLYKNTNKISKENKYDESNNGYHKVVRILRQNNRRIQYLNKYSAKDSSLLNFNDQ